MLYAELLKDAKLHKLYKFSHRRTKLFPRILTVFSDVFKCTTSSINAWTVKSKRLSNSFKIDSDILQSHD